MPGFARFGSPSKTLARTVGLVLALIAGSVVFSNLGTSLPDTKNRDVAEHVSRLLRSGATEIDMRQAADFPWDEMFVFNPYYPKDGICEELKLTTAQCSAAHFRDVDEGEFFLVFMQEGRISEAVELRRAVANFDESHRCLGTGIRRSAAVFTVERKPEVYLVCR
jgi:hypothetical protein